MAGRIAWVAALWLAASCAQAQPQPSALSPSEVANLASRTFALWECAALAASGEQQAEAQMLFDAGLRDGRRFISEAKSREGDEAATKAIVAETPMIISMNLGGPSADFMLGQVWGATILYAEDKINNRDTWSHQKSDPSAESLTGDLRKMTASNLYRERNCRILAR